MKIPIKCKIIKWFTLVVLTFTGLYVRAEAVLKYFVTAVMCCMGLKVVCHLLFSRSYKKLKIEGKYESPGDCQCCDVAP